MLCATSCYYLPEPLNWELPDSIDDTIFMDQRRSKWFPFRNKRRVNM